MNTLKIPLDNQNLNVTLTLGTDIVTGTLHSATLKRDTEDIYGEPCLMLKVIGLQHIKVQPEFVYEI